MCIYCIYRKFLQKNQPIYTQNVLEMFFAEDCLVTDATFEDEILKLEKFI